MPPAPEPKGTPHPLSDGELVEVLDTLPKRPLLAGREGLRLSLAGAQTKLPVVLVDDRAYHVDGVRGGHRIGGFVRSATRAGTL